jgi:hypothetical protein
MTASGLFSAVNVMPLPIWAIWMLAPRSRLARSLAASLWPWAFLAAVYTAGVAYALATGGFADGSFSSLEGVMRLFDSPTATLIGWVHYLCFDLFVGRWIMNDAPQGGYRLAPVLFLTLMFGPAGLLVYIAGRDFFRGPGASAIAA